MANSCDIYFYKISGGFDQDGEFVEGLGIDRLSRYASQFGFGRVQGIELPLEAAGDLPQTVAGRRGCMANRGLPGMITTWGLARVS